ncbi:MAG: hypothetical protein V3T83_18290 [Acidobacteriota bacterium]
MDDATKLTAEHYQKTYELTLQMWEQRNTTFLLLLAVVGAATVLTFNIPQAEPLLVDLIAKVVGITEAARLKELRLSFPYGVVQSILLMIILYLTVILYHRTAFIRRCYLYLGAIEPEIKSGLGLPTQAVVFTRESTFYQQHKAPFARYVAATYIAMLGSLLVIFLGSRVYADFAAGSLLVAAIDVALAAPTLLFFIGYARSS